MPPFVRVDEEAGIAFVSCYDAPTFDCISEKRCDPKLVQSHPYDRLIGIGRCRDQVNEDHFFVISNSVVAGMARHEPLE